MLRSEEERERRKQFGGEYRDYEQDDDDDDDDEEDEDEDEDEDDYEDDIEEEDEEEQEDYEGENENQHYNDDAYNDTEGEEYDSIAECDYGYENNINESDQPEDEHMEVIDLSDGSDEGSDEEQDETYYDGEEGAEVENYQGHSSSPSPPSIYDGDASAYRDYHCQEQYQVSEDCYQDHLHHSAPLPPTEPSRQVVSLESMTNNMEDDQYFLDAVPEMKVAFGLDHSDDSNHLFGCLINHSIGNSGLHRQSSQMVSYDAGEGTGMTGYLPPPPPPPPTLSTHQPKDVNDRGSSELNPAFGSMDDYQHLQQHKQQEQQVQQEQQQQPLQEHQQLDFGNKIAPQYPPEVITTSQVPDLITIHSSPEDQDQAQTHGGSIATTSTSTTIMTGTTRPRSSFLTLPGPISTYWKRLKRGPSSTPSSSRPPSFPP
ncbi:hypothetical protein BGX30_003012 [Mortierella sp. GBA39]|nr:hypothetical protein BGX30_003012 [Mortierella sp. GBA39]